MPSQTQTYDLVRLFITIKGWTFTETNESTAKRLDIQHGQTTGIAKIYSTGTLQVQGPDSQVKNTLLRLKELLELPGALPDDVLINTIKTSITRLSETIPSLDPTVVALINQSIVCLEAGSLAGCTILIGCASERAVWLLIDAYSQAISDKSNRDRFIQNTRSKYVAQAYDIFKQSVRSCKNHPEIASHFHDWQTQVDALFNFFRTCRNEVGHPIVPPSLDKGSLLANLGQFAKYIEIIGKLINYFKTHKITL